jgi:hypothetical protein
MEPTQPDSSYERAKDLLDWLFRDKHGSWMPDRTSSDIVMEDWNTQDIPEDNNVDWVASVYEEKMQDIDWECYGMDVSDGRESVETEIKDIGDVDWSSFGHIDTVSSSEQDIKETGSIDWEIYGEDEGIQGRDVDR